MIVAFDLDDTLYDERCYIKSGFAAVGAYLEREFRIDGTEARAMMLDKLDTEGRGRIFDETLRQYGIFSKKKVEKCLSVYRLHEPKIDLAESAITVLDRFGSYTKYVVTDGNKFVQKRKITALNLYPRIKKALITHCYGIENSKPSPYCFQKITEIEKCSSAQIVYIGDNPHKDFVGIKPLGFKTIRVLQGQYQNVRLDDRYEAEATVDSLVEITEELIHDLRYQ